MKKYIIELKNRFILLFLTWSSIVIVTYLYKETLLFLFVQPNIFTNENFNPSDFYFIFTNITDILYIYLKLVLFVSIQIFFLYSMYQSFAFLSLALFKTEYYFLKFFLIRILLIWFFSVVLLNYFFIPLTWFFFFSFQNIAYSKFMSLHFEAKLDEYLNFYISLYYLCVFYCQVFTILFFLLSYSNSNILLIKKFRKIYYYCFLIFSTLVSPPDVFSQILISFVLIFIFEILVFIFILKNLLIRQPIKTN